MSLISDAKNLYVVDDRTTIKNYINRDVDYWVKMDTVPTLEQVIEDLFDNDEFICQSYEESKRLANKDWLEMLSVYSIAKNIQNLVSFNMPDDFDESKCISKKKKLQILESDKNIPNLHYDSFPWSFRMVGRKNLDKDQQKKIRDTVTEFIKNAEAGHIYSVGGGFGSSGSKFKVVNFRGGLGLRGLRSNRPVKMTRQSVENFIFNGADLVDIDDSAY